jgi:hypothetical protein
VVFTIGYEPVGSTGGVPSPCSYTGAWRRQRMSLTVIAHLGLQGRYRETDAANWRCQFAALFGSILLYSGSTAGKSAPVGCERCSKTHFSFDDPTRATLPPPLEILSFKWLHRMELSSVRIP